MYTYDTLSEALADLKKRGYTEDFSLTPDCLECSTKELRLHPENFNVDEFYRFEGDSNPDDNCIVYAISSIKLKGVLVDAYGVYSENISPAMAQKLRIHRD